MTISAESLISLCPFVDSPQALSEAGNDFVLLPNLKITVAGAIHARDGLLCPQTLHGYLTRLFISEPIPGRGQNWKRYMFFGRPWYSPSWQGVDATLPFPQMLLAHLGAYR